MHYGNLHAAPINARNTRVFMLRFSARVKQSNFLIYPSNGLQLSAYLKASGVQHDAILGISHMTIK